VFPKKCKNSFLYFQDKDTFEKSPSPKKIYKQDDLLCQSGKIAVETHFPASANLSQDCNDKTNRQWKSDRIDALHFL